MRKKSLKTNIYIAIGFLLLLLLFVIWYAQFGLVESRRLLLSYRDLNEQSLRALEAEALALDINFLAFRYRIISDVSDAHSVKSSIDQLIALEKEIRKSLNKNKDSLIIDVVDVLEKDLQTYRSAFASAYHTQEKTEEIVSENLAVIGARVKVSAYSSLENAAANAQQNDVIDPGAILKNLSFGRLLANRFLRSEDEQDLIEAKREVTAAINTLNDLQWLAQDTDREEVLGSLIADFELYLKSIKEVGDLMMEKIVLYRDVIDLIGPKIIVDAGTIKEALHRRRDQHQEEIASNIQSLLIKGGMFGGVAFVLALVAAFFLTNKITNPVLELAKTLEDIASDDLTVVVSHMGDPGEVGSIARAVNKVKDICLELQGMHSIQDCIAESRDEGLRQDRFKMAEALEQKIGPVIDGAVKSLHNLMRFCSDMGNTVGLAEEKSASARTFVREVRVNLQSVLSSAEELSASIKDGEKKVCKGANQAVLAVDDVQSVVCDLGTSSQIIQDAVDDLNSQTSDLRQAIDELLQEVKAG